MKTQLYKVAQVKRESHDTWSISLKAKRGRAKIAPGQFNMIYIPGVGESAISFSDVGPSGFVHTVRSVGSVTQKITRVKKNQELALRGPYGRGWPMELMEDHSVVVVAGGIGLAPLRPVILELLKKNNKRVKKGLRTHVYYGARSPEERIFVPEINKWQRAKEFSFVQTLDRATAKWKGNVGVVTTLINELPGPESKVVGVLCGPEIMIRYGALRLLDLGVSPENIFVSLERNMKCAIGFCGHCQMGPHFICKGGPVFSWPEVENQMKVKNL